MARILITSIGKGMKDSQTEERQYLEANYVSGLGESEGIKTPYIFEAISQMNNIDNLILIGTAGSDWNSLYFYLCDRYGVEFDVEFSSGLLKLWDEKIKYDKDIESIEFKQMIGQMEKVLASVRINNKRNFKNVKIIILKYGLEQSELNDNFALMQQIDTLVANGDEIIFDITHSFRSLAFFELITVNYIKEVRGKKVSIKKVTYGMLEVSKETGGRIPIVNLKSLITTMDCMKAIEEFRRFGTTYTLCDVLEQMEESECGLSKEEQRALNMLNETISSNDFAAFRKLVRTCKSIRCKQAEDSTNIGILSKEIYENIADYFGETVDDPYWLQIRLGKWHYDKKRYSAAATTMAEAIIGFCLSLYGIAKDKTAKGTYKADRDRMRKLLRDKGSAWRVIDLFNELYDIRNELSHPVYQEELQEKIEKLGKVTIEIEQHYKRYFSKKAEDYAKNRKEFEEMLREKWNREYPERKL